jgi:hypothetical protein
VVLGRMQLTRCLAMCFGLAIALLAGSVESAATTPPQPAMPGFGLGGGVSAARIVDRTFACVPIAYGGVGDLDVNANPPADHGIYEQAAMLAVRTGGLNPNGNLVFVRTRPEEALGGWRSGPAGVYANSRRCTPTRARLPLSRRGLAGPPAQWRKDLDCRIRGRVLVRVRSILTGDASWRRIDRFFEGARQPVVETRLAVRTQQGAKPIAYMEHDANGKVKLWYSGACS